MGRQVRRVPKGWEHPRDRKGRHKPLLAGSHEKAVERYEAEVAAFVPDEFFDVCPDNPPPPAGDFMFDAEPEDRPCVQYYESTTDGTPISPVFDTVEQLAEWLARPDTNKYATDTASYEEWLAFCQRSLKKSV